VNVTAGMLAFTQTGAFSTTGAYTTAAGASTFIAANASLAVSGALTQDAGSLLFLALGSVQPVISASTANLGGTLNITGFSAAAPTTASALGAAQFKLIHTTGGIANDFAAVSLGSATSPVDYLTLAAGKSADGFDYNVGFGLTWLAGATLGNGVFTLAGAADTFNVDVALGNQAASATGWDGTTLTKNGAGTLLLSAVNGYTGPTLVNAGTLQTGIANAFASSSAVNVASGATLDLNNFNQTANNLTGAGDVTLGSAALTANNTSNTTFGGAVSGGGSLFKTSAAALTLTGDNSYSGGTTISAGTLQIGNGGTTGSIAGDITDNGALVFNRSNGLAYAGTISGAGSLTQAGTGTTTLTGTGSSFGGVNVAAGVLALAQAGAFTTIGSYTTAAGAATSIAADASLTVGGGFTQAAGSTLDIALGSTQPVISAATANLGGTLDITGLSATVPTSASALDAAQFKLIHTTGGIANDFAAVNLGGATSPVDYLTLAAGKSADGFDYNVGFGLTWLAGATLGNGVFTLAGAADTFNVDVALGNQAASATGWDGTTLTKDGAGTLLLSAVNGYTGPTLVNAGTLQTGIADAFASSSAVNVASGATLDLNNFNQTANNLTGAGDVTLGSAALTANNTSDTTFGGTVSGGGSLVKTGAAALTLTGDNAYTGGTTISAGTLQIGNGGTTGSLTGNITDNGALVFNRSDALVFNGAISGSGTVTQAGSNLVLTGTNTYTGGTVIESGTLQLGAGGTTGSIVGDVIDDGTLAFNRSDAMAFAGSISGSGSILQAGTGTVVLSGDSGAFAGTTAIVDGVLQVDGVLGAAGTTLSVASGGAIAGHGTIGGNVSIADGILAPGGSTGTLTIGGNLDLASASILDYEFGQAGVVGGALNDLTVVGGNLTLDGTLNVATASGGTYAPGLYRIINYSGSLVDNGLVVGSVPAPGAFIQTSVANQVNLINTAGLTLSYWDGAAGPRNDNVINGGSGLWQSSAGNDNWTTLDGSVNAPFSDASFAVFSASRGTVDVDNSLGAVSASGLQFAANGYVVQGGPIALVETDAGVPGITTLRVGDGSGAIYIATLNAALSGAVAVDKTDVGTLILGGTNTYSGGTRVSGGTLSVSADTNLGAAAGSVTLSRGTLESTADFTTARTMTVTASNGTLQTSAGTTLTADGVIDGAGTLTKAGDGTLLLAADNTYAGGTTLSAGTLQLGNGGTTGGITGDVANDGTLVFNRSNSLVFAGSITGAGSLIQTGSGITTLAGDSNYTGGTTISAGTLQIGNGGTTGSLTGNITDNGALVFNRSNGLDYAGTINGSGSLTQAGTGTTTLTGAGSSVGAVNVTAGMLALAQTGTFTTTDAYTTGAGAATSIAANATLAVGGALTQDAGSLLAVVLGSTQPVISASTASLGGTLNITGVGASVPTSATALPASQFTIIHAAAPGGISNDFAAVALGGASSPVDYLVLAGGISPDAQDYNVGLGLAWLAGATLGNGVFTLVGAADTFNVDVALGNQAVSATGWDGTTLTKNGAGTLLLSAADGYTGPTLVNAGTLQTGTANAFASSSAVNVASGATLALNNFNQTANNLAGAGNITLGSAVLTASNSADTLFGGTLSGGGGVVKTGTAR
jgi:autotransporter-associated beta strand protein